VATSTKVEVYDPGMERPLARVIVPGDITQKQLKKEIKVGVTLVVDLGDRKKKKTFTVPITDENLRRALEDYVGSLRVRLSIIESEERAGEEIPLGALGTA